MNWYKIAQNYAPIAIVSYIPSYGELGISFNGGKKYIYPGVSDRDYNYIEKLLKNKNYQKVQEILKGFSSNQPKKESPIQRGLFDELV